MASWVFPTITTGVTVETATLGALTGDGSSGNKLAVTPDGVTIDVNGSNQLEGLGAAVAFKTIAVSGQSSIVADAADDTLTIVAGSNITLTTNASTDTLTIAASGGGGFDPAADIAFTGADSFSGHPLSVDSIASAEGFSMTVPPPSLDGIADPSLAGAAGLLSAGVYRYKFTFTTPSGETLPSAATNSVTVSDPAVDGQTTVPIPESAGEGTFPTSLGVYRTKANDSSYFLLEFVTDYSGPYFDDIPDSSLTVPAPSVSTAIETGYTFLGDGTLTPPLSSGAFINQNVLRLGSTLGTPVYVTTNNNADGTTVGLLISGGTATGSNNGGSLDLSGGTGTGLGSTGGNLTLTPGFGNAAGGALILNDGVGPTPRITIGTTGQVNISSSAGIDLAPTTTLSVGGTAGVTAGPFTAITSITVKNGLITAIVGT